jgi:hypothetical protein
MAALILLRSHMVNDHVRKAYEALRRHCETSETLLLLDVSNGDAPSDMPTLRFSGDRLARIGLTLYPQKRWAWFAGDYALYCAFLDRPEFSHYVMIDYDARVNFSIDEFVARLETGGHDFVAPYAGFENADWMWTAAGRFWFERVAGSLFPIIAVSRRLIIKCLEHRLSHSMLVPAEEEARQRFLEQRWMNCEAFVPSVALREGYSIVDIQKLMLGWNYAFIRDVDVLHWDMPQLADVPCAHPVFLKTDLPEQIRCKLRDLPQGELRSWLIARAKEMLRSDHALWSAVQEANAELRD